MNSLAILLFRLAVRLYPAWFRREFGADMEALFSSRLSDMAARRRRAWFCVRTVCNVARMAIVERVQPTRNGIDQALRTGRKEPMNALVQDIRYALRLMRRQPAFSLFVVLTLGVGTGANTAVFSVINGVLLRPLPFHDADRLVAVWGRFDPESGFDFPQFPLSAPEFVDYRQATRALKDIAAYNRVSTTIGVPGSDPERVPASGVTGNLFEVLGVAPVLGRTFRAEEVQPGGPALVLLSYGYWLTRFGGDPGIVGSSIDLNGNPTTVIGVMSDGFAFPHPTVRLWVPLRIDFANPGNRKGHSIRAIGRLAEGQTITTARTELHAMMQDWRARFPDIHTGHYLFIRPMLEDVAGTIRPALMLLFAATGVVLLIVCANVASVVLARGEARTSEMAIRGALGAERWRLVRLSLIESGLLAGAGGAIGLALAVAGVRALVAIDPASVPRSHELALDGRVVVFTAAASALSALAFGLLPAMRGARADLQGTLREVAASNTAAAPHWFRSGLVVAEVTLCVALVLGAGLMLRSFSRLVAVDPGFRPDGLISAAVSLPASAYAEADRVDAFYGQLVQRLQSAGGVTAAAAGTTVPFWSDQGVWDFEILGTPPPGAGLPAWNASAVVVRAGYFETLEVPLVRGRFFLPEDDARGEPVVVVNQSLAKRFFAGEDPLGRRIRVAGGNPPGEWMTVVGIAADARTEELSSTPRPAYFMVQSQTPRTIQSPVRSMSVFVRTDGDPAAVMPLIRAAVRELDPKLAVYDVQTSRSVIEQSVARPRFTTVLLTVFAAVATVLGATGIYGVLAYTVARRTREIGIRRALGAQPSRLRWDVVRSAMLPVLLGVALGLMGSYWTTRLWSAQLFDVSPTDPLVYVLTGAGALAVALAATIVPTRRALRVSPLIALRA